MTTLAGRISTWASFVRISHSVFALPFALVGALLAARETPLSAARVAWIIGAMVTARSAAMGFNRLADAHWDALNPRTAMREIPRGAMSRAEAVVFVTVSSGLFIACAAMLGPLTGWLAPVALAIVFWYSLAKRVTHYTQLFLGLAMAVAPVGGWIAAGGGWSTTPAWLAVAIATWVGGFDVLYACQDVDFDRAHGLHSIPVRFGVWGALWMSRGLHVVTVACLWMLGVQAGLTTTYFVGTIVVALLLVYEQSLVSADDLSQVKQAFDLNGYVGIVYLVTTGAALYVGR